MPINANQMMSCHPIHRMEPFSILRICSAPCAEKLARISIDTRFCDYGAPVFFTNLEPHHSWRIEGLGWDSIYHNWKNEDLQFYWRDYPELF